MEGDHLVDEGFIDIRSGRGLLGSVLEPPLGRTASIVGFRLAPRSSWRCVCRCRGSRSSRAKPRKWGRRSIRPLGVRRGAAPADAWESRSVPGARDDAHGRGGLPLAPERGGRRRWAVDGLDDRDGRWTRGPRGFRKAVAREGKSAGIEWGSVDPFGVRTVNHNSIPMIYVAAKPDSSPARLPTIRASSSCAPRC